MSANILHGVLNDQLTTEEIFRWLISNKPNDVVFPDLVQTESSRAEFVLFFLDYLRKQCPEIQNTSESEPTSLSKKSSPKTPNKVPDPTKHASPHSSDQLNLTCCTSTPLKSPSTPGQSFENRSVSFNNSFQSSPINGHQKFSNSSLDQPSTSSRLDNSFMNASRDSNMSNFSVTSVPYIQVSPLYSGAIRGPFYPLNPSHQLERISPASAPSLNPPIRGQSFDNRSISVNSSALSGSIYRPQNLSSSFDQASTSSLSVSPLYPESIREPLVALNSSHQNEKNFPSIEQSQRHHQRHNKSNSNTPQNKKKSPNNKQNNSGQKKTTIQFGDFFGISSKKSSKNNNSRNQSETKVNNTSGENLQGNSSQKKNNRSRNRRIKPTKLEVTGDKGSIQNDIFGVISRPETKNPNFLDAQTTDKSKEVRTFETERELLKLERQRRPKNDSASEILNIQEQSATKLAEIPSSVSTVPPKLSLVDNAKALDKLAELYGNLIKRNLVPNVMTELYFIMTLITSQFKANEQMSLKMLKETMGCKDIDDSIGEEVMEHEKKYLNTPHNCVYFATNVLCNQKDLLVVLDRATIKLLYDNLHIGTFKPELRDYLGELYDKKVEESNQFKANDMRTIGTNVCFQIDTDNRDNFPSTIAFSKFRMQRDLFYESLKIWEDCHQSPNWCFSAALERKINSLLSLHDDAVNYYHLGRLFKSQLLTSCLQHSSEDPIDDETLTLLKSLKSMDLKKFKQLQGRLVTPLFSEGIVPVSSFPGIQEFYRDFLLSSSNVKFNSILENCFIQEITDLNSTLFATNDIEARETNVDETTKHNYLVCISNLRLLAKFLGFLVSIPFKSKSVTLVERNTQISLRRQVNPSLKLQETLFNAFIDRKLTLTVPWMVEYLAVLDPVAFRLPYYEKLCQVLYYIYRNCQLLTSPKGSLIITFCLGRLFELPNFPKDLYFTWQSNYNDKRIKERISLHSNNFKDFEYSGVPVSPKKSDVPLDKMELIDDRAIIVCCPFLKEFKILLISGNCNIGSINRHITPVSTQLSQPSSETKAKTLQLQQEDAFFHGQPDSVKKTVDFVAERIASNSIKQVCRELIPSIKLKHFNVFKQLTLEATKNRKEKQFLDSDNSPNLVALITKELRDHCNKTIPNICKKKCSEALIPLLSEDLHPAVKEMCVKICMRLAIERIVNWLDFYINDAVNSKQIHSEYAAFTPKEEVEDISESIHNPSAPSPTQIIDMIRDSMWELIEKNGKWSILTEENILKILKGLKKTLRERKDLQAFVERMIYVLTVDYAIHLIVYNHCLFTDAVLKSFIDIWRNYEAGDGSKLFGGILSCRNIQWLRLTCDSHCWRKFGKLIDRLLREKLLGTDNFSDQCVAIFRQDLPGEVTRFLPECLNEAIQGFKADDDEAERIRMMLRWISGACGDLDGNGEGSYGGHCKHYGLENSGESPNFSV